MKIRYIDKQEELQKLIDYLTLKERFAIDLEFDKNRFQYGFTMCLMQVYDGAVCYIIDPLAKGVEIRSFFPLIEDAKIQKVGFELGEDLRLFHSMGCSVRNIYDVSIASKLLDHSQISLVNAIERILGITTSKGSQKSNWVKRPLSETQLNYAAEDVAYLFELKDALEKTLMERNMLDWVEEERRQLENVESTEQDALSHLKAKDSNGFTQVEWQVLKGLMEMREDLAKRNKRPAYQVLDKDYLLELAQDESTIRSFHQKARPLRSLNTEAFKTQLLSQVKQLRQEALDDGLSLSDPAFPRQSKEELRAARTKKKLEEETIDSCLKPIQQSLKNVIGEHAAVYIMGNRLMRELALGDLGSLLAYKKALIDEHAALADVDLSSLGIEHD